MSNSLLLIITSPEMVITRFWRWNQSNCMRQEKRMSGEQTNDRDRVMKMKRTPIASLNSRVTFHALSKSANSIALWRPDADSAY